MAQKSTPHPLVMLVFWGRFWSVLSHPRIAGRRVAIRQAPQVAAGPFGAPELRPCGGLKCGPEIDPTSPSNACVSGSLLGRPVKVSDLDNRDF